MAPEWEAQKRAAFETQNGELRTSRPSNYAARQCSLENEITMLRQEAQANANPQKDAKGQSAIDAHDEAVERLAALSPEDANSPACFVPLPSGQSGNGRYAMTGSIVPEASAPGCRQVVRTRRARDAVATQGHTDTMPPSTRWPAADLFVSGFAHAVSDVRTHGLAGQRHRLRHVGHGGLVGV
jgi:hypothetical protein